jgi:nucleoside-diphosphate-sugar epimerase
VHTTVRDCTDNRRTQELYNLPRSENLRIYSASLTSPNATSEFVAAFNGTSIVFHSAAPVSWGGENPQETIIDPMMLGTSAVLAAVDQVPSVKRLVVTSSVAASMNILDRANDGKVIDEKDWNYTSSLLEGGAGAYRMGKRMSEEAAWKWAATAKHGCKLTTILPFLVIGHFSTVCAKGVTLNLSIDVMYGLVNGSVKQYPGHSYGFVDVDDVIRMHIMAAESDVAINQRYLCVGRTLPYGEICHAIRELAPDAKVPETRNEASPVINFDISCTKAIRELGFVFTPFEETLLKTIESLRVNNWM